MGFIFINFSGVLVVSSYGAASKTTSGLRIDVLVWFILAIGLSWDVDGTFVLATLGVDDGPNPFIVPRTIVAWGIDMSHDDAYEETMNVDFDWVAINKMKLQQEVLFNDGLEAWPPPRVRVAPPEVEVAEVAGIELGQEALVDINTKMEGPSTAPPWGPITLNSLYDRMNVILLEMQKRPATTGVCYEELDSAALA
ncbi:hypothetical protein NE237_006061 [Protea cynaroides]|uniref:Uncharacterized protein n=1 Tax=Protea cynaroides TaxID=273540 RepID=A0A9Q0KLT2_9MAGN|nr:hypothetical protein NE237_006061 [Protea cynaroides]